MTMPSFYELLKYAKTGIASSDMTAYDKMKAIAMAGGAKYPVATITGIPPISFKSDGRPLAAWSISGNSRQDGTPAPDDPIYPDFVGERTENLFDKDNIIDGGDFYIGSQTIVASENCDVLMIPCKPTTTYTVKRSVVLHRFAIAFVTDATLYNGMPAYGYANNSSGTVLASTSDADSKYLVLFYAKHAGSDSNTAEEIQSCLNTLMVVEGSTAPDSYIPYGYKISLTSAGQTVPVYLGQVQIVRQINKKIFTGDPAEDWHLYNGVLYSADISDYLRIKSVTTICSHYPSAENASGVAYVPEKTICMGTGSNDRTFIRDSDFSSTSEFRTFLAEQYQNGTPLTVWYVLANEETGTINEPLRKIGAYADTLDSEGTGITIPTTRGINTLSVGTDLQPSEMSITGHIKPL